jgi:integral membrane protein TerC family protein
MEWLTDPTIWAGLLTLVVLEIILGIDNLIFIAILADKVPPSQRDRARVIGLSLALLMRLGLLASISWVMSLTAPLFTVFALEISWRDLILVLGGVFLLIKATIEIHDRLEVGSQEHADSVAHARFLAGSRTDRGARRSVLARLGHHGHRHGRRDLRYDGRGRDRDDRDARREQAAHQDRKRPSVADHPLFGIPPDGGLCLGCRRLGLSHT